MATTEASPRLDQLPQRKAPEAQTTQYTAEEKLEVSEADVIKGAGALVGTALRMRGLANRLIGEAPSYFDNPPVHQARVQRGLRKLISLKPRPFEYLKPERAKRRANVPVSYVEPGPKYVPTHKSDVGKHAIDIIDAETAAQVLVKQNVPSQAGRHVMPEPGAHRGEPSGELHPSAAIDFVGRHKL